MTENLHTHARSGTLNLENLGQLLIQFEVDDQDIYGDTALDVAIRHGHVGSVKLLLQAGADANRVPPGGKSPIYTATQAPNSGRIVELLLKHGAKPDEPVSDPKGDTPLMSAIRQGASPEAIRALAQAGASMDKANEIGETAKKLAEKSTNTAIHKAIRPKDEAPEWKPELENFLVSSGLFALAYFKNFKDVGLNAINRVVALSEPTPGVCLFSYLSFSFQFG
jgi:ankyrin repeat protein